MLAYLYPRPSASQRKEPDQDLTKDKCSREWRKDRFQQDCPIGTGRQQQEVRQSANVVDNH
jgi:hypothetical protein